MLYLVESSVSVQVVAQNVSLDWGNGRTVQEVGDHAR